MATTNRDLVGNAMDALKIGLVPFVSREFNDYYKEQSTYKLQEILGKPTYDVKFSDMDVVSLLKIMESSWNDIYQNILGYAGRSLVSELRGTNNRWAHQTVFTSDDTYRVLDSAHRLLLAISAPESSEIEDMKMKLLRRRYDETARTQRHKTISTVEGQIAGSLSPWREVINPHHDVASGQYQQAEFAADLWQVHLGEGSLEYRDSAEFFRRTYLTNSLKRLLGGAVQRLAGEGGDPVIQVQTNFGGGKTHAMLALYHLFSGAAIDELSGMDEVVKDIAASYSANRVVLVGNRISPGHPDTKSDGTKVRTLWGELAWQLGHEAGGIVEARQAYELVRADDENATNPGDALRKLLNRYSPSLILIDEWVAYARQLHDEGDLPAGSFETQFTFAQALSESAKLAKNCLVVISLPASDIAESTHLQTDDIEVGGTRGRAALNRLSNIIGRIESSWRPASADESFEIVRRRLFQPISDPARFTTRDNVARAFRDLYSANRQEFPVECIEADYEKRIIAAYPIHPEVFERLYTDWSTLRNFQRTRGVLRLMATVIHSLWENGDRNPLILPAHIPIEDSRVQAELTRYLSENWVPVIERDIDGANSLPKRLDGEIPNLGKYSACRRVARSIYLGSAPIPAAANRGIGDRRIKLGCVIPGESPTVFGDAIRRLGRVATYLYQDGARYWYSTQPTVAKLAESRAEEFRRTPDRINQDIRHRLQENLKDKGEFNRIHIFPSSGHDVRDGRDAGLVLLEPSSVHEKGPDSRAITAAESILESRGNSPRLYKNTLVFLAADNTRLQDLTDGVGMYLAWQSILADKEQLDLPPHQVKQAQSQLNAIDGAVSERIGETYRWLLVPIQQTPKSSTEWRYIQLSGNDHLASLASEKMVKDELLITSLAGTRLRMEMDRIPLWRGGHVSIQQLAEDFARYSYLPMLKESSVLLKAIQHGLSLMVWEKDSFAYADSYDNDAKRYLGLQVGSRGSLTDSDVGLLVRPERARKQMVDEVAEESIASETVDVNGLKPKGVTKPMGEKPHSITEQNITKRYHGSVTLDHTQTVSSANQIVNEVVIHMSSLVGAEVKLTLHIEAEMPGGVPKHVERTVIENSRTLNFIDSGFENE